MTKDDPRNLYQTIEREIDSIFSQVSSAKNITSKSKEIQKSCLAELTRLKITINDSLNDLDKHSEWDSYTIAFYGETNAGKSTIIECLRLYFSEETKINERRTFEKAVKDSLFLKEFADGNIIGDGRPDFTRKASHYHFGSSLGKFSLIDVPGIEGNEQKVNEEILTAVKKAHAVFYVTGKAAPPQKGEGDKIGTIEKIKAHLNDQATVYAIYNKRITNAMALKSDLVSADEQESIVALDKEMTRQLGKNYAGSFCLSAWPAFFSLAKFLMPDSDRDNQRKKMLVKFKEQELLNLSKFNSFTHHLVTELLNDYKSKIVFSNLIKALCILRRTREGFIQINDESIKPLISALEQSKNNANYQLDRLCSRLPDDLTEMAESLSRSFKSKATEKIYSKIDRSLSNDAFKEELRQIINDEIYNLKNSLEYNLQDRIKKASSDIDKVIIDYQSQCQKISELFGHKKEFDFNFKFIPNFDMDNGINGFGIFATLLGIAMLAWNPAGWVIGLIGAVSLGFSFVKSIWGYFSSSYKESQQRKSADKNIHEVGKQIKGKSDAIIEEIVRNINVRIKDIKLSLNEPIETIKTISTALDESAEKLQRLEHGLSSPKQTAHKESKE